MAMDMSAAIDANLDDAKGKAKLVEEIKLNQGKDLTITFRGQQFNDKNPTIQQLNQTRAALTFAGIYLTKTKDAVIVTVPKNKVDELSKILKLSSSAPQLAQTTAPAQPTPGAGFFPGKEKGPQATRPQSQTGGRPSQQTPQRPNSGKRGGR